MSYRWYFSMSDFGDRSIPKDNPTYAADENMTFKTAFAPIFDSVSYNGSVETPELIKLLQLYLWPRFYDAVVFYIDTEDPEQISNVIDTPEGKKFAGRILSWLRETQSTFGEIAKLYESQAQHLMDQISSKSTVSSSNTGEAKMSSQGSLTDNTINKHNDTPQISGGVDQDSYVSDLSQSNKTGSNTNQTSSTTSDEATSTTATSYDNDTVISRLEEIRQKLVSIYGQWADDFRRFVLYV